MFTRACRISAAALLAIGLIVAATAASAKEPVGRAVLTPSLFGSTAISIGHTTLDAKWRAVSQRMQIPAGWVGERDRLTVLDGVERLIAANTWVNHQIRHERDGAVDHWASATETAARGGGDCEDFAIAKIALLRAAGVEEADLYLSIVRDTIQRADHAVLLVRTGGAVYVLDSLTDRVLPSTAVSDYRPIVTLAFAGAWVHGFPQRPAETQLAAR
jgi:predicted transglutaminase-like cysteine proteinase